MSQVGRGTLQDKYDPKKGLKDDDKEDDGVESNGYRTIYEQLQILRISSFIMLAQWNSSVVVQFVPCRN